MHPILSRLLRRRFPIILLATILLYGLVGFFALPSLLHWRLPHLTLDLLKCHASAETIRINPFQFTAEIEGFRLRQNDGTPLLAFDRLFLDLEPSSLVRGILVVRELALDRPEIYLAIEKDGSLNLAQFVTAPAQSADPAPSHAAPLSFLLGQGALQGGKVFLVDKRQSPSAELTLEQIDLRLHEIGTLQGHNGDVRLTATTAQQESIEMTAACSLQPIQAKGALSLKGIRLASLWQFARDRFNLEQPEGTIDLATDYQVDGAGEQPKLSLAGFRLATSGLGVRLPNAQHPLLRFKTMEVSAPHLDPLSGEIRLERLLLDDAGIDVRIDDQGAINLAQIVRQPAPVSPPPASPPQPAAPEKTAASSPPFKFRLDGLDIKQLALALDDKSRAVPYTATVAGLDLHLRAGVELGSGPPSILLEQINTTLKTVQFLSAQSKEPLFATERLVVENGVLNTGAQKATVDRVALSKGRIDASLEADGTVNWQRLFAAKGAGVSPQQNKEKTASLPKAKTKEAPSAKTKPSTVQPAPAVPAVAKAKAAAPSWTFLVKSFEVDGFSSRLTDLATGSSTPVASVRNLSAKLTTIDGASPMGVTASLQVEQGGTAAFKGTVHPAIPAVEAEVNLQGVALTSLQPYIAQVATLTLQSALVSASGRLAYGVPKSKQQVLYTGSFSLNNLRLTEAQSKKPFGSWEALSLPKMQLTLKPDRLEAEEVILTKPVGEFIIGPDKILNLSKVLKEQSDGSANSTTNTAKSPAKAPAPAPPAQKPSQDDFSYQIGKVRVEQGNLVFGDFSLRPQFMTRIHDLKGTVTGLSTVKESQARVQMEGQVDQYGTAKIMGLIRPSDVPQASDIEMVFRNLEMKNLSPYSGRFAGRLIKSGKVSADLHYTLRNYTMTGENRIIIDNLTLGDKVEDPEAANLPLDLAIALLRDANGRIDVGLPVSGDLNDPQFSIGSLVWKVFTNLIAKATTAPFRALGSLLGGGDSVNFEALAFDPGSDQLPPPEKEKLLKIAEALKSRPQLKLTVQGRYSPEADGLEFKERAVRRAVAARLSEKQGSNDSPEPLNWTDSGTRGALEKLYAVRFGKNALEQLESEIAAGKVTPRPPPKNKGKREPESTFWTRMTASLDVSKLIPGGRSPEQSLLWAGELYTRLVEQEKVNDEALLKLAERRGLAVAASAENPAQIPKERLELKSPEPFAGSEPPATSLSLEAM